MADPTTLTLSLSNWTMYLGIAVFGFFTAVGSEIARYVIDRWVKKRLDNLEIKPDGKGGIIIDTNGNGRKKTEE